MSIGKLDVPMVTTLPGGSLPQQVAETSANKQNERYHEMKDFICLN